MTKAALLLIDIQNDYFPGGAWEVDGMEGAAEKAARALAAARTSNQPVIHIRHEATNPEFPFFQPNTKGAGIHPSVAPLPGEEVILKHRPNAFFNTPLAERLTALAPETLLICGAMSQMCIDSSTRAAADLGYKTVVLHDACAAKAQQFGETTVPAPAVHAAVMAALSGTFAEIVSSQQAIDRFT